MQIEIRGQHVELTGALRSHIERRVLFALGRFQSRIFRVTVRLQDVNGPRGGVDKGCRLSVELVGGGSQHIDELSSDLYIAVDGALERTARVVERELSRQATFERTTVRGLATIME
ncbi:MAG: HPF/RaiA family ribosome-associated protein [Myxococcota bacterium]